MINYSIPPDDVFMWEPVLENCPLGVLLFDETNTIRFLNSRAEAIIGFNPSEAFGSISLPQLVGSSDKAREIQQMVDGPGFGGPGQAKDLETTLQTKDGQAVKIFLWAVQIQQEGVTVKTFWFFRKKEERNVLSDVAEELFKAQKALRQCEDRYQALLESSPDAIVLYDPIGQVTYVNPSFTRMYGWSNDEIHGKRLDFVPEENKEETGLAVGRMVAGEKIIAWRTRRLTKDGQKLDVQLSASMIYDQEGQTLGTVVIFRDIGEQLRAERERVHQERLQGVLEMAVAAAHEMSQPLQLILGDASYLLSEIQPESDLKEAAANIMKAATQLGEVVYKIQRINRYETAIYVGNIKMVDLEKSSEKEPKTE